MIVDENNGRGPKIKRRSVHVARLTVRLERPIDIVPRRPVVLLVIHANIIGPPCGLHKQHHVAVGNGNILKPRLPLVRVPGMLCQYCFNLLDGLWVLLL